MAFCFDENMNIVDAKEDVEEVKEEKYPSLGLFDIINDISVHGNAVEKYIQDTGTFPSTYSSYMITKAFGNSSDTIMLANEMNMRYNIPNRAHECFLRNTVSIKKRFGKWFKPEEDDDDIIIAKIFGWSLNELRKNKPFIQKETMDKIKEDIHAEKYTKGKR